MQDPNESLECFLEHKSGILEAGLLDILQHSEKLRMLVLSNISEKTKKQISEKEEDYIIRIKLNNGDITGFEIGTRDNACWHLAPTAKEELNAIRIDLVFDSEG